MVERGKVRQEIESQVNYLAAARDFSSCKMTLLDAAKHYGVSFEDLYKKTIIPYQYITPFHDSLYIEALYNLIIKLGSKAITLPLMDKEIMQVLKKVVEENNVNLQRLWIEYNYERLVLKTFTMNIDMSLTLLDVAKRRGTNDKFIICRGCMLDSLPDILYEFVKERNIPYPRGWDIYERAGIFWLLTFESRYRYEIKKNFPFKCGLASCLGILQTELQNRSRSIANFEYMAYSDMITIVNCNSVKDANPHDISIDIFIHLKASVSITCWHFSIFAFVILIMLSNNANVK